MNLNDLQAVRMHPDEHAVLKFRKHWFILFRDALGTALSVFLPPLALVVLALVGIDLRGAFSPTLVTFVTFWWLLIIWLALAVIWTNYYLDLWLVTDKRLISVDQSGLFKREVTTLSFSNIQDVTVEQYGVLQTLLNFGTLTVQTAGPTTNNMSIRGVAQPSKIRDNILKQCERMKMHATAMPPSAEHA